VHGNLCEDCLHPDYHTMRPASILVADDDPASTDLLRDLLSQEGYLVAEVKP